MGLSLMTGRKLESQSLLWGREEQSKEWNGREQLPQREEGGSSADEPKQEWPSPVPQPEARPWARSFPSVQFSSVAQSCPILCNPVNRSIPGLPVHHQLPEFTQTHAHRVGDAIQPSHPLSSPSPPAPNPSQHKGLFQ